MPNSVCSKCLKDTDQGNLVEYLNESVCKKCKSLVEFLQTLQREQAELRQAKQRPPIVHNRPATPRKSLTSPATPQTPTGPQIDANAISQAAPDEQGRMWYAVSVFGGDRKAARTIKDFMGRKYPNAIGRVLIPKAHQDVALNGKLHRQYRRAMPGYLLVKCRPDYLDELGRCPMVGTVLPFTEELDADQYERAEENGTLPPEPQPIPQAEVEPFLRKKPKATGVPIHVGDRVRVAYGQWEGQEGEVCGLENDGRVCVEVMILGMPTEITELKENVQKLSEG